MNSYIDNEDKQKILSGGETTNSYQIYPDKIMKLSLKTQRQFINRFDFDYFQTLYTNKGNYQEFLRYFIDNNLRKQLETILGLNHTDALLDSSKKDNEQINFIFQSLIY